MARIWSRQALVDICWHACIRLDSRIALKIAPSSYFFVDFETIASILTSIADIQFVHAWDKIYDGPLGLTPIPPNYPS